MKKTTPFRSFHEYLTGKDKVVTKPPVETVPDYKGPKKNTPPAAVTSGKGWSIPKNGKRGTAAPYKTAGKGSPKSTKEKGGFGDMGNKDLIYQPAGKGVAGNNKKWPDGNTTTESFLDKTKDMSIAQFAKHVKKNLTEHCGCEDKKAPHVVAYSVGAYHPDPIQAIKYVTYLANENIHLRRALIREAKRAGCTSELLYELLQLPESFTTLAQIIDGKNGDSFTKRLEKAIRENRDTYRKKAKMNEEVDEPAHQDDLDLDDADESELKDKDDDLDLDGDEDGDLDGDEGDGDLDGDEDGDLDGDVGDTPDADGNDAPPPPPDDAGGEGDLDLDVGDTPPPENAGDGDLDGEGGDVPPPPDDAGDDGDDDLDGDDLDLHDGDDDGDGDSKIDFDDEGGDDKSKEVHIHHHHHHGKKMPWEDDDEE